jgi:hypothetical protein
MTVHVLSDLKKPICEILQEMGRDGALLGSKGKARFALLPLDDDLLDFLLEHSPKFIAECRRIRKDMEAGNYYTHEEVRRMFGLDKRRQVRRKAERRVPAKQEASCVKG